MKLEDVIKLVQDCPSSIFTTEDAVKIFEMVEDESTKMTDEDLASLKKRLSERIEQVFENESLSSEIEVSDIEIKLGYDNDIEITSVEYSMNDFGRMLRDAIINL